MICPPCGGSPFDVSLCSRPGPRRVRVECLDLGNLLGTFYYGGDSSHKIEIDDRILAHLQIVMVSKLRRGECFVFVWNSPDADAYHRTNVWIAPPIPLRFEYSAERAPTINRNWLEVLAASSNGVQGLRVIDEPDIAATATPDI